MKRIAYITFILFVGAFLLRIPVDAQVMSKAVVNGHVASGACTSPITDAFQRGNANPVSDTTCSTWNEDSVVTGHLKILGMVVERTTNTGADNVEYNTAISFPDDQRASVTIDNASGALYMGPVVRSDGAGNYYAAYFAQSDGSFYLLKVTAGTPATLHTFTGYTYMSGDKLELSATGAGTTTLIVSINDVAEMSVTDSSSPFTSGSPGMVMQSNDAMHTGVITLFCGAASAGTC